VADAGQKAAKKFLEFFAAQIRNRNTRKAYHRNAMEFFAWTEGRGLALPAIEPLHVAAYIEQLLAEDYAKPTVKQHLATVRMLFDWLVVSQVVPANPAHAVRGPKHVIRKGKTPALDEDEARLFFESFDASRIVGLRNRALAGVMLYTFARVEAALSMNVQDYYPKGKRSWVRLHEKNDKVLEMPAHHRLEEFMDAYITGAELAGQKKKPLFRAASRKGGELTNRRMTQASTWTMIRRHAARCGIETAIGNHSFRATGITNYLQNGGKLETAQQMAGHESSRTTSLYDRRDEEFTLDEIERISI
jgi:site-specific recombinase XerD